jgi:hypothetical protein
MLLRRQVRFLRIPSAARVINKVDIGGVCVHHEGWMLDLELLDPTRQE